MGLGDPRTSCHAEGRGFESLQPLSQKARSCGPFVEKPWPVATSDVAREKRLSARRRSGTFATARATGCGPNEVAPMTSTIIGHILPVAAQGSGLERRCWSATVRSPSPTSTRCRTAPRMASSPRALGRATASRSTVRTAGSGSSPTTASPRPARSLIPVNVMLTPGRGPVRRGGLRHAGRGRVGGQGRAVARSPRDREPPRRRPVGRGDPAGATAFADWLADARRSSPRSRARRRRPGGRSATRPGTTGRPRARCSRTAAVIGAAVGTAVMAARGPGDRVINSLPLPHVYGSCASSTPRSWRDRRSS